jgi:MFS transporter, DHA1 family, inner membrane transport protein
MKSTILAINPRILSLVFAPFAFGTSAFVILGLINTMALDLSVSVPKIGYLQFVFAATCALAGPFLARFVGNIDRKKILIFVMLTLVLMNVFSALAQSFEGIVYIRLVGGFFAALTLPVATTIAVAMVEEGKRPAAIATVLSGYTLAFLVGIPLGSVIGDALGWRGAFWFAAAMAFIGVVTITVLTPNNVRVVSQQNIRFRSALAGQNLRFIGITLLIFLATFTTVAYIGPVITYTTQIEGAGIGAIQVATGIGGLIGLPLGAFLACVAIRCALFILLSTALLTQLLFSLGMFVNLSSFAPFFLMVVMAISSAAVFAALPLIQSHLVKAAGSSVTIAFALNSSMVYLGQGLGSLLGGVVIAHQDMAFIGSAGAVVAFCGLLLLKGLRSNS